MAPPIAAVGMPNPMPYLRATAGRGAGAEGWRKRRQGVGAGPVGALQVRGALRPSLHLSAREHALPSNEQLGYRLSGVTHPLFSWTGTTTSVATRLPMLMAK